MSKMQPLLEHGYNREEAYFYEQEQKLITKFRRIERKRKSKETKGAQSGPQSFKKAA